MESARKAESIQAVESKLPMPNDNQASKLATKRAPKLGQIGRTNSAVKNGKTIFASQNVSLDIPRKSSSDLSRTSVAQKSAGLQLVQAP